MKKIIFTVIFAVFNIVSALEILPNNNFSVWSTMPKGDFKNWKQTDFPEKWRPVDRSDYPESSVKKISDGILLNGFIASSRLSGFRGKTVLIKVTAKGSSPIKAMLLEYVRDRSSIEMTALVIDTPLTEYFQEYTAKAVIPSWHGEDEIELALSGENITINSVSITEAGKANSESGLQNICTLPIVATAPKIDGKFTPREWAKSIHYRNSFRDITTGNTSNSQSECFLTSDGKNFYIAMLTPIPPGGFRTAQTKRDSKIWTDESLELVFNPNFKERSPAELYQIIINFAGVIFDQKCALQIGQNITGYDCPEIETKNGVYDGQLLLEVKVPLASVGISDPNLEWGMTVGRNLPLTNEAISLSGAPYRDTLSMLQTRVSNEAPAVSFGPEKLDDSGSYRIVLKTDDKVQELNFLIKDSSGKEWRKVIKDNKNQLLIADFFDKKYDFLDLKAEIRDSKNKLFFFTESKLKSGSFGIKSRAFALKNQIDIEYYPFQKKFNARLVELDLNMLQKIKKFSMTIIDGNGKKVEKDFPPGKMINGNVDCVLKYELDPGFYNVKVKALDSSNQTLFESEKTVPVKNLEWVGNNIGKEDIVLPPFIPMQRKDATISCVLRDYTIGDGGLLSSLNSNGGAVLANPIKLRLKTDGKVIEGVGGKLHINSESATRIEFSSEIKFPDLNVGLSAWMEYDGVLFYTMTMTPLKPLAVSALTLEIEVEDAGLFHFTNDAIRGQQNYFHLDDFEKKAGIVWKSTSVKNYLVYGNFISNLYLGNYNRGLSFFAENEKGWITSRKKSCYEIKRTGKNAAILVNFINTKTELNAPRTLQFGLIATPVKPQKCGISQRHDGRWMTSFGMGYFNAGLHSLDPWISNQMVNRQGKVAYLPYSAGNEYVYGDPEIKYFKDEIATVPKGFYTGTLSEVPYMAMGPDINNYVSIKASWTKEQIDFRLWRLKKLFDATGIDGVYLDNSFPRFNCNLQVDNGGFIRHDGQLQGTFPILLMREYLKRCATLAYTYNRRNPKIIVHNTNAQIIAGFTFADGTYDGEMALPKGGHYEVFYPAWTDISLGVNWGVPSGMLTMSGWGSGAISEKRYREMYSMFKLYDTAIWSNGAAYPLRKTIADLERRFKTNAADSKFVGFYEKSSFITGNPGLKISYFVRPGKKALAYVVNPTVEPIAVQLKINSEYGIDNPLISDGESGKIYQNPKYVSFNLDSRDFRVLLIEQN